MTNTHAKILVRMNEVKPSLSKPSPAQENANQPNLTFLQSLKQHSSEQSLFNDAGNPTWHEKPIIREDYFRGPGISV